LFLIRICEVSPSLSHRFVHSLILAIPKKDNIEIYEYRFECLLKAQLDNYASRDLPSESCMQRDVEMPRQEFERILEMDTVHEIRGSTSPVVGETEEDDATHPQDTNLSEPPTPQ
jgi:hypothetical protein